MGGAMNETIVVFEGEGDEKFRPEYSTRKRRSVVSVVKHFERDEYLCLETSYGMRSFVLGGIEGEETIEQTALREVAEETGFINIKIDYVSPVIFKNRFFYASKGENRESTLYIVFCNLIDETRERISEIEEASHTVHWVPKDKLEGFLTVRNNQYIVKHLLQ